MSDRPDLLIKGMWSVRVQNGLIIFSGIIHHTGISLPPLGVVLLFLTVQRTRVCIAPEYPENEENYTKIIQNADTMSLTCHSGL